MERHPIPVLQVSSVLMMPGSTIPRPSAWCPGSRLPGLTTGRTGLRQASAEGLYARVTGRILDIGSRFAVLTDLSIKEPGEEDRGEGVRVERMSEGGQLACA